MEERLRHFETLCLPGPPAQTDSDFGFLIFNRDSEPPHYLERLTALVADLSKARIVASPA